MSDIPIGCSVVRDSYLDHVARRMAELEDKLERVRKAAHAWEADARRLNTVPTFPASTLMDCREEILSIVGEVK